MSYRKKARTLVGVVAGLTLLGLVVADTLYTGVSLSTEDKLLLVSLISGTLGVDIALKQFIATGSSGGSQNE